MSDPVARVARTIERYGLLSRGRRIAVAVSGGADSVFLLHALHQPGLAALVLHVNHKLRGAESDDDESFVAELAASLNLPFASAAARPGNGNVEQEARRARYAFFESQLAAGTCDAVATGHTRDDQAETVLYRFLRGAGTAGLSGIRVATESGIIRPLIDLGREEIRQWLDDRRIAWREDASNQNLEFARNRLRCEIIPRLTAAVNASVTHVLAQTASWAAAEEDYWTAEMERLAALYLDQSNPELVLIRTDAFVVLPVAVQRRLLRHGVEKLRNSLRSIDFGHIEAIRALMATREGSGRLQIPDLDIYRSFDWLRLGPVGYDRRLERDFEVPLAVPGVTRVPGRPIAVETELVGFPHVYNEELEYGGAAYIAADRAGSWVLRNWRPGDRYRARGRADAEKIKSLFQEFRVPLWERRNWPVIALNGDIVWSRKFGVAREFAAGPGSQRVVGIREWKESNPYAGTSTN